MKWRLAIVMALAACTWPALAQSPAAVCPPSASPIGPEERAQIAPRAQDRGLLWRISKEGRISYLYGTVHLGRREWVVPGPQVSRALQASQVYAMEIDLGDPDMIRRLQAGMAPKEGEAGAQWPDDLKQRMRTQLRAACAPEGLLAAVSPEMLATLLTAMAARQDGLDVAYAIDPALAEEARRLKKPVVSLETPELQLSLLRSRDAAELRTGLEKMLGDLESGRARPQLLRVARVWAEGAEDELSNYRQWCDCANTEAERRALQALLDDRNPLLADGIDRLHREGRTVFAAVGSLHMVGDAALPALMAQRGYRVERIRFTR